MCHDFENSRICDGFRNAHNIHNDEKKKSIIETFSSKPFKGKTRSTNRIRAVSLKSIRPLIHFTINCLVHKMSKRQWKHKVFKLLLFLIDSQKKKQTPKTLQFNHK